MGKEKIKFSKEIVKNFDLFMAVLIGLFATFVLYFADSSNFLSGWGFNARMLGFLRNTLVYGAYAAFLGMGVVFALNTTKKSVTMFDFILVCIESFGISSLVMELVFGANTQVFDWYVWAIVAGLGLVLLILRSIFVCEEPSIPFGGKKYFAAIAYRYNFAALALFGLAVGVTAGAFCSSYGINNILNTLLPAIADIPNSQRYGMIVGGVAAVVIISWITTILNNLRSKVNFGDALLVFAQIVLLGFSVYFAPKMPAFKPNFLILYVAMVFVLLLTSLLRSMFINVEVKVVKEKPSIRAYYYEVCKKYSITLLTTIGIALSYLLVIIDINGLATVFSSENVIRTVVTIVLAVACAIAAIVTLAKKQLVSKKAEFIDALLYIAVCGGVSGSVVMFTSFNIIKIAIWAVLFLGVLAFVAVRIKNVLPELTPVEEVKPEVVEEKKEEVVEEEVKPQVEEEVQPQVEEEVKPQVVEEVQPQVVDEDEDENGGFRARYKKSFLAKLTLAEDEEYDFYNAIKNHILTYKVKARLSWNYESFNAGRKKIAKLNVRGKTLVMYIALDPAKYENTKYSFRNVFDSKKYADTPMMVKIRSPRGLKYAKELVDALMLELGISLNKKAQEGNYRPERKDFDTLLAEGEIKDLWANQEEKPEVVEEDVEPEQEVSPEENEAFINSRYKKSFRSRFINADDSVLDNYNKIKNLLLSYKNKSRMSWSLESFNIGRKKTAKINIRGKSIALYLALDPAKYKNSKYHFKNVSKSKRFADTPMMVKVRSPRSLKYALELINAMMSDLHQVKRNIPEQDFREKHMSLEELIEAGYVKDKLAK